MLKREELEQQGPPGFTAGQKEKDYVQHWTLTYLTRTGLDLVFKGGTCLQKAYNLPRYSEDLDFTAAGENIEIKGIDKFFSEAGFSETKLKKREAKNSASYKLRTRGPLYVGKEVSEVSVTIEISKRERIAITPLTAIVKPPYSDLSAYQVLCMDKAEIAAEKIRAIYTRESARDLYDLYYLLYQKANPSEELVNEKLAFYELKFSNEEFEKRIAKLEREWKREISSLTQQFIEFNEISETVKIETRKLLS
ncbi:MAG: nucleotidyl transferase AbiEii/AbiGii toxin family protein [Candidatus Micrarchaeota archaeon]|nr:nucleotidyl transferase AbiEii/AbiGii toxin family protein [Candidatus Micrarchaeota archaeon]